MANPYGLPENDPLLTGISPFSLREQNQQAANNDAAAKYAQYILNLEREKRLAEAAKAGTAQAPTLGAINQALQDYTLNPAVRRQLEMQRAKISGMSDAQIAKEFPEQSSVAGTAAGTAGVNTATVKPEESGSMLKDTGEFLQTTAASAIGGAIKLPGDILTLLGSKEYGPVTSNFGAGVKEGLTPDSTKQQIAELGAILQDDTKTASDVGAFVATRPDVLAYFGGEFLGAGGLAKFGVKGAGKLLQGIGIARAASKIPGAAKIGAAISPATREATGIATAMSAGEIGGIQNQVYNEVLQNTKDANKAAEARQAVLDQPEIWAAALLGTIPVAEFALAAKRIPALANLPFYKRAPMIGAGEAAQEFAQESAQASGEMGAKGDTRSISERMLSPEVMKQGTVGAVIGGTVGAGLGLLNPGDPNAPTNTPPGATPPGTAAPGGSTAIDTAIATNANLAGNVRIAVRNAIRAAKGDSAAAEAKLISLLGKDPYFSSPELKNAIPAFAKARIAAEMAQTGAAPAAPAAAAPAPAGATGAAPAAPVATPAPAAPAAAPVAPAAAPAAPSPVDLAAAAQATAQSTGNADINSGTVNAAEAKKVTDDLRAATTKAEAQPEKSAAAIAEALLGGKSEAEVADVLQAEQTAAQKARQKMEETLSKASLLEVDTRAKVRMHVMRNAMARGMDPLRAEEYAGTVARLFAMPDITGLDQAGIDARIAASLRTTMRQVDALYTNPAPMRNDLVPPPPPPQNKELRNLGTRGERVGVNSGPSEPAIVEGEFADVTPQLALPQLGRQSQELIPAADTRFNGPEPTRPTLALPQLGRQSQELVPTADANFRGLNSGQLQGNNLTPAGLEAFAPNVDPFLQEMQDMQPNNPTLRTRATRGANAPIEPEINPYEQMLDPIAAQEFEAAIREGTPESLARAQAIVDQAMAEAPAKKHRKKAEPKKSEGKKRPKS